MTVTQLLPADLSAAGPIRLRGFIDSGDAGTGIEGWALDLADPDRPLVLELRAGTVVVAAAEASRPREDVRRLGSARCDVGFRFDPDDLRSKMAGRAFPAGARLRVWVAGTDFSLGSSGPLPSPAEFARRAGAETPDLPLALRAAATRAAELLRAGPVPEAGDTAAGWIECLHRAPAGDGHIRVAGWMPSRLPLAAPVAVVAGAVAHPSALVAAPHGGRADLPEGASGILGLLETDWRPDADGVAADAGARLVFLEGAAAGACLRLVEGPELRSAAAFAGRVAERGRELRGPFADALRLALGPAAEAPAAGDAAPPDDGFDGLMRRGAALRAAGDRRAALGLFRAALALRPRAAWARMSVADALADLGRLDEAEEICRAVLADEPGNTWATMSLGHALRRRGNPAGALPLFRAALALRPRAAWARMSVADALADLGRLDEAEEACRAVLADEPDNSEAMMALGRIANAGADRRAGAAWFERAARAAPGAAAPLLALADAQRDLGDFDAARRTAETLLAAEPGRPGRCPGGWMSLGHTERRADRREAALRAFSRASELEPDNPAPLVEMAVEERGLGRPEESARLLERALRADGGDAEALLQLGEHHRLAGDLERALDAFRRATAPPRRPPPRAFAAAAQALAQLGEMGEALRALEEGEARVGANPESAAKRIELLRRTGDRAGASRAAEEASRAWPRHFEVWFEATCLELARGGPDACAARLDGAPSGTTLEQGRVHALRGLLAAERSRLDEAIGHQARAVALNPGDGWPRTLLAHALLLTFDTDGAREQLERISRLEHSAAKLQGRSTNVSQTHLGQLLDEFVLDRQALEELRGLQRLAPAARVGPLLAMAARCPDHTPAAIGLVTALRQSGCLARRAGNGGGARPAAPARIPRTLAQYWDDDPPPRDLAGLMGSWGKLYPRFDLRRFTDRQAQAFLARSHGADVQAAYRRARQPAQKADIFRLAFLHAQGGFYADADDRLVGDLEDLRFPGAGLVLYQEDIGTVGNNLIGAVPGHPLIGRALRLAVEAVNRGDNDVLWLSTGPGMLTRAFAALLADPGREPLAALDDVVVLEHWELQRTVSIHCSVGYKNTERHWSRTAFGTRAAAAGAPARGPSPAPVPAAPTPGHARPGRGREAPAPGSG